MKRNLLICFIGFILLLLSAKTMAANANLNSLTVSAGTFSPTFTSGTYSYTISESSATASITFTPTQSLTSSTITINGTAVATGTASGAIALSAGLNTITIVVSKSFNTTETYTITVTRQNISYAGSPFTYYVGGTITSLTPTATGSPTGYSVSPTLPAGLSINGSGVISGTPGAASSATTYTITATYSGGITATTTINITVLAAGISYAGSPFTYYAGTAITALTPTVNGTSPLLYSGTLPAGLTLNVLTGQITGTPTATSSATSYTITATYLLGGPATASITITVLPQTISYTGSPFTYYAGIAISSLTPTVTNSPASYGISPGLPTGLSFSTSTGVISGTATVTSSAATYTVTANYGSGVTAVTTINITVLAPTISYTGSPFTYVSYTAISSLTPTVTGSPGGYSVSPALPAGLSISATTGIISGTPTTVTATASYTITASYTGGVTAITAITITVNLGAPVISYSPSTNIYTVGTAITSLTPTNTAGTAAGYSINTALPAGLTFNTATGVISGTPTAVSATTIYTITATNTGGSGSTTVTLTVNPAPPAISYSPAIDLYTISVAISPLTPTNTGGAATSYSISAALPAGLAFSTTTGVISGTPTVTSAITTYTITATNAAGSASATVTITVAPPKPVISYSPSTNVFTVGTAYTLTPTNTGGADTIYSIGPSLPAGLSFNTYTGVISGTPTAVSAVTTYIISGDNDGGTSTTTVTLSCVLPAPPAISYSPSTNTYTVGTSISSLTPTNTGGAATTYSIGTTLPAGLSFSTTTGVISGTPTAVTSTATYTVTATNSAGSGTATVTITVKDKVPVISYSPSTNTYTVGTPISSLTPANTGGTPTSYSISTALPAGLSFSTTTGVISGTPTATSSSTTYTITATNATGSGTTTVTIAVNHTAPAITYSPGTVIYPVGTTITPATPVNTGGAVASYSINITLPTGLSFNTSTGVISGTPTVVYPTTTFTITATNTAGSSNTNLIITVSPAAPIISYTPSTNVYTVGATITTLTPANTGGSVVGYSYASTGTTLTGATLSGPSLMTIDASGNIYVANWNNKTVSRWNASHTYLGTFGTGITMSNPEGIVFDSSGNAYVEDTGSGAVYKFNSAGVYQSTIITGLSHPLGISIDASNNLYIATYVYTSPYTSSVTKYTTSGTLEQTLPNTNMNESDGVAVDQASGNIYVLNRANNLTGSNQGYVTYYNSAGTYLGTFSSGYSDPLAISVDPSGNVFVADSHNDEVKIYSNTGVLLNTIPGFTDVEGFVADASGNLYVSDFTDNTVKEYLSLGGYHISAPLPPGLSFSTTTGQISGTPTTTFPATTYTITAYNITGSGTTTVTLSCIDGYDWIGVTSTDWNTASNWVSNIVPTSSGQALIGVNRTFNYFPNVTTADGTVNVGSIAFGNLGSQAPGVVVNSSATLNVSGAITYQSDASAGLGYTCTLSGAGILNADSILVKANTALSSSYTGTMASSVTNLNVSGNISLTSSNSGSNLYNAAFNVTGGTTNLTGIVETSNTSTSTSTFAIVPASTATLQLGATSALSGLSSTGTNVVTFNNSGATVNYSGTAQTIYTDKSITGLSSGVSYQSIAFSGTGIATAESGNLNIAGNFTNTIVNDGSDYLSLSNPTVNFNGTTQALAGGSGNGTKLYKVTFSGAGTKTMSSGKFSVAANGTLTMIGNNALTILNAGGALTLLSTSTSSATVAAIPAGPTITGNVNVQRYVTGGAGYRGYRLASSPVYAATVGSNNVYSINYLQNSIYLTGSGGGFDKIGNPTIYLFREDQTPSNATFTSGNFWGISAINNSPAYNYYLNGGSTAYNLPAGNGFMYFFRGNRASASLTTETQTTYTTPVTVTMAATGTLNQGQVTVSNWYTPTSSNLGYTGTGTGTNYAVRGFNLVGNPYASSVDWESYNTTSTSTGIYASNVGITVYELNPVTNNYDIYQKGGIYTNHGKRTIVSGEGFFVLANSSNAQLIFNESAKTSTQLSGLNLFMDTRQALSIVNSAANTNPHLRLQLAKDTVNTDDIYIGFDSQASAKFVPDEDAPYKIGSGQVSIRSYSADSIMLAINKLPLPGLTQTTIPLFAGAKAYGTYSLNLTELEAIPEIYQVWLMDKFNKDSLDIRHNPTYTFDITTDTGSYGGKRFQLVIRQDPALAVHLLSFSGQKMQNWSQIVWVTENEQNYTNFTVERSTDGGATWNVLGGVPSAGEGTYSFSDKAPVAGADSYRLQITDLNGTVTYSNVVTIMYGNSNSLVKTGITVYPNPAKSMLNLSIATGFSPGSATLSINNTSRGTIPGTSYDIQIANILGAVIKKATINQQNWQTDVSGLTPGTYVIQVTNKSTASVVGQGTFVKL